jgi:hypothetical protein
MTKEMAKKYIRQQIDLEVVERATAGPGEHAIGKGQRSSRTSHPAAASRPKKVSADSQRTHAHAASRQRAGRARANTDHAHRKTCRGQRSSSLANSWRRELQDAKLERASLGLD